MAFRDSLPAEGMTWDNMDSVVGVFRVTHKKEARWCAQWREPDPANPDGTIIRRKTFSVHKYGEQSAHDMAINCRMLNLNKG